MLSPEKLVGSLPFDFTRISLTNGSPVKVVSNTPSRVGLVFCASFTNAGTPPPGQSLTVNVGPYNGVGDSFGISLTEGQPKFCILFKEFGAAVSVDWYAYANANGCALTVLESRLNNPFLSFGRE